MVILFDQFNLPEDIFKILFATEQQEIVAKELIKYMKRNNNEINKTVMSIFATQLHEGTYETTIDKPQFKGKEVRISYNKRQFYDRILTPMKSMGLIEYDLYKKTYRLSENFNKVLIKIGLMWTRELRKPAMDFKTKGKAAAGAIRKNTGWKKYFWQIYYKIFR
jgi:hypothetical protein